MSEQKQQAHNVTVHGRVQGVGFRYNAQKKALQLGLTGWVRNRGDGKVEAHFEGSPEKCSDYLEWLHHGPPGGRVLRVDERPAQPQGTFKTFNISY